MMESIISNAKTFQEVTMPQSDLTIYLLQRNDKEPETQFYVSEYEKTFLDKDKEFEFLKSVPEVVIYPFSINSNSLILNKMLLIFLDRIYDYDSWEKTYQLEYKSHIFRFKVLPYRK